MKSNVSLAVSLVVALTLALVGPEPAGTSMLTLSSFLAVFLQLSVFADSGAAGLRRVSAVGAVVAVAIAAAETSALVEVAVIFLAGLVFSFRGSKD